MTDNGDAARQASVGVMSAVLLLLSVATLGLVYALSNRIDRRV